MSTIGHSSYGYWLVETTAEMERWLDGDETDHGKPCAAGNLQL